MVEALKNLRQSEPENYYWAQLLGYVRYRRGGWEILDAFNQMNAALSGGVTNRIAFGVAAEASRFLGNHERAAEILRAGVAFYPDDRVLLNNLVYVLTQTPGGLAEARARLPRLLTGAMDDPRVLDTAAAVYVADGDKRAAQETIAAMLTMVEAGTPLWFRAHMHAAQLAALGGRAEDYEQAIDMLRDALRACESLPDDDAVAASRLIATWNDRVAEAATREPSLAIP
jgi:tetratricopeptide (TPR) repeat protein